VPTLYTFLLYRYQFLVLDFRLMYCARTYASCPRSECIDEKKASVTSISSQGDSSSSSLQEASTATVRVARHTYRTSVLSKRQPGGSYKANNNKNRNSSVMQAFNIHMGRLCGACPLSPLQRRWQQQQPRLEAFPSPSPILLLDQAPLPVCGLRAASVTAIRAEAALGTARALLHAPQAPGHAGSRERPRQRRRGQRPNANSKAT
jgi:hypothetical protein